MFVAANHIRFEVLPENYLRTYNHRVFSRKNSREEGYRTLKRAMMHTTEEIDGSHPHWKPKRKACAVHRAIELLYCT